VKRKYCQKRQEKEKEGLYATIKRTSNYGIGLKKKKKIVPTLVKGSRRLGFAEGKGVN